MYQTANSVHLIVDIYEALNQQYSIQQLLESLVEYIGQWDICNSNVEIDRTYAKKLDEITNILSDAAKEIAKIQ